MSIEGYSFGVTFFDVVGSAGNAALYFMREEERAIPMGKFVGFPMGFPRRPQIDSSCFFQIRGGKYSQNSDTLILKWYPQLRSRLVVINPGLTVLENWDVNRIVVVCSAIPFMNENCDTMGCMVCYNPIAIHY
jgi:hypothetical protein